MTSAQVAASRSGATGSSVFIEGLIDTLRSERRLIDDLRVLMIRQREAVAGDQMQELEDTVFAVQRVMLTLGEARKRRRTLSERLGCDPETTPRYLPDALGSQASREVVDASRDLVESAEALSREVAVNRDVLQRGLSTGEEFVRILTGAAEQKLAGYSERAEGVTAPRDNWLVNRQV